MQNLFPEKVANHSKKTEVVHWSKMKYSYYFRYTHCSVFGPQYVEVSIRLRTWTFAHLTVLYWTGISESAGAKQTDGLVIGLEIVMRQLL